MKTMLLLPLLLLCGNLSTNIIKLNQQNLVLSIFRGLFSGHFRGPSQGPILEASLVLGTFWFFITFLVLFVHVWYLFICVGDFRVILVFYVHFITLWYFLYSKTKVVLESILWAHCNTFPLLIVFIAVFGVKEN